MRDKQWLELKPSANVEVFSVNDTRLNNPDLTDNLYQQFKQHEESEIKRIALLLRFLQSKSCLSYGLAKYFDDHNAPVNCGHCTVCQGKPAALSGRDGIEPVPQERLQYTATQLKDHLLKSDSIHCSNELIARYLVGINVPIFTTTKAKKSVPGFGMAESMRYQNVVDFLDNIE